VEYSPGSRLWVVSALRVTLASPPSGTTSGFRSKAKVRLPPSKDAGSAVRLSWIGPAA